MRSCHLCELMGNMVGHGQVQGCSRSPYDSLIDDGRRVYGRDREEQSPYVEIPRAALWQPLVAAADEKRTLAAVRGDLRFLGTASEVDRPRNRVSDGDRY